MSTTKNLNETFTVQSDKCKYTDENIISDFKWVAIYDGPSTPFCEFRAEKKCGERRRTVKRSFLCLFFRNYPQWLSLTQCFCCNFILSVTGVSNIFVIQIWEHPCGRQRGRSCRNQYGIQDRAHRGKGRCHVDWFGRKQWMVSRAMTLVPLVAVKIWVFRADRRRIFCSIF